MTEDITFLEDNLLFKIITKFINIFTKYDYKICILYLRYVLHSLNLNINVNI